MSRRELSNPLALAVLTCLGERPMYPYEITATLRHRHKEQSIRLNYGSLYSVMRTLEKQGLIREKRAEREGNRPERTVYELTDAGRQRATGWLSELLSRPTKEYPEFEAALSLLPALPPAEVRRLLTQRLERLETMLAELTTQGNEAASQLPLPELFYIEHLYERALLEAELTFTRGLIERLTDRTLGGIEMWERTHELIAAGHSYEEIMRNAEGAPTPEPPQP